MLQFFQFIHLIALKLMQVLNPLLVPLCFVLAWGLAILTIWNLVATVRDGLKRAQVMHRIPCAECRYFTNSHLLKCPIHPKTALSEAAIGCSDYESTSPGF